VKITKVNALPEDEVSRFLCQVDLLADYQDGRLECAVCGAALVEVGLGSARRVEDRIAFACAKLDCMRALESLG
jgi:hypothetical protein